MAVAPPPRAVSACRRTVEDSVVLDSLPRRCGVDVRSSWKILCACGGCAILMFTAGCGTKPAAATASAAASPSAGVSAYLTCLRQHGATVPTARPTARPSARPSGPRPSGGPGGGFAANPTMRKAMTACASLRPKGGFGRGFGGQVGAALTAFRTCMAAHGETVPTTRPSPRPTARPTGDARFLNGLDPTNPKVAAALKACASKIPAFPRPGASATP
jgi:hypothetical protein